MHWTRLKANLLLITVALCWGGSFVLVRDTVRTVPAFLLIGLRFLIALLLLACIFPRAVRRWASALGPGILLGLLLLAGFTLQTFGLCYTTASNSGFITGLNVVFVAVFAVILTRGRLPARTLIGAGVAGLGLAALSWQGGLWSFGRGDLLTLACAVAFALHIIVTGRFAPRHEPVSLAAVQFAVVMAGGFLLNALTGASFTPPGGGGWLSLCYLGLLATGFAFLIQTMAQRHTPSVDTAIILSTEPLFAAAIAVLLGGERLTLPMLIGGGAIFAAMLLAVANPMMER